MTIEEKITVRYIPKRVQGDENGSKIKEESLKMTIKILNGFEATQWSFKLNVRIIIKNSFAKDR